MRPSLSPSFGRKKSGLLAIQSVYQPDLIDPFMCQVPDHVVSVWSPLESIIDQIEKDGTVDTINNKIVFTSAVTGELFDDATEALNGVIEFHRLAQSRHGIKADTDPLARFSNKLSYGTPITAFDIERVRSAIADCKRQAMNLRRSQAIALVRDIQIVVEMQAMNIIK